MSRTWWVTRPEPQASAWVRHMQAAGVDARALPLLCIADAPDPAAVQSEVTALLAGARDVVMFVSVNAAEQLLQTRPELSARFGRALRAWAVGPGTVKSLMTLGVSAHAIDAPPYDAAQFDSEALWQCVQAQVHPGFRVCFMRGADEQGRVAGRDWLSDRVLAQGGTVSQVAVYARVMPPELPAQLTGLASNVAGGWLFSSSHALHHLKQAAPLVNWRAHRALCTHERIAAQAVQLGFGAVRSCRPQLDSVLESIESWA